MNQLKKKIIFLCLFYIDEKSFNVESDKKEINEIYNQRAAARKTKGIISSDAMSVVIQKETSVGIRSSGLVNSEVLQNTLEGKHRSYRLLCAELMNVRTMRKSQKF